MANDIRESIDVATVTQWMNEIIYALSNGELLNDKINAVDMAVAFLPDGEKDQISLRYRNMTETIQRVRMQHQLKDHTFQRPIEWGRVGNCPGNTCDCPEDSY